VGVKNGAKINLQNPNVRHGPGVESTQENLRPLYHLIDDVFPFVPENDVFLAVSEIFVHLEILINEGRAALGEPGPPAVYRALE